MVWAPGANGREQFSKSDLRVNRAKKEDGDSLFKLRKPGPEAAGTPPSTQSDHRLDGVGFLIHRDEACNISDWKYISDKREKGEAEVTPNEDDLLEAKDNYFDQLGAKPKNCGGQNVKATKWWSKEIEIEVKEKKRLWKMYLSHKSTATYRLYKDQRIKVKGLVKETKRAEFGNFLKTIFSENYKLFYKTLKRMRQPRKCSIKYILNKEGKVLRDEEGVTERWREYFSEWKWRKARQHRTGF
ncbi:hypothetical protein ILUMI_26952 [Ignelater luminosus]|uniref:Uncharacterized protein n=1 Tax=Ignelater luminosus TaxID=2038154 RepID=A0A8K0FX60_IGNLU|nr:hypothetical protein ILUMI_26952 [Ignelater luminosus]